MGVDDNASDSLMLIEEAGRTCYKSNSLLTRRTAIKFVQKINKLGHLSVIEHSAMSVKFIVDRGVSHELVRHRLASFSQESTRYCNYKGGVTFIIPPWCSIDCGDYNGIDEIVLSKLNNKSEEAWFRSLIQSEHWYIELLNNGWSPQQARSVLPNSLKTEIVITANFREWQHIFTLRCSKSAHPQMREIMIPLHIQCKKMIPEIFDNIDY